MDEQQAKSERVPAKMKARDLIRQPRIVVGAVAALVVAAGIIAWAVSGGLGSKSSGARRITPISPVGVSATGLRTLAHSVPQPIYWAGPKPGYLYELTRTAQGNVFIRYLPPGVSAGAKQANYLVIGTYPFTNALQALKAVSHGRGVGIPGGGLALVDAKYPKSVHLAFPLVNYQVEVYDPSPARARSVALSGAVRPVP
jgi:hypothetical protein